MALMDELAAVTRVFYAQCKEREAARFDQMPDQLASMFGVNKSLESAICRAEARMIREDPALHARYIRDTVTDDADE